MDIEDFVKQTLAQITSSVNNNKSDGDIIYAVNYETGVDFDLAVTTTETKDEKKSTGGGLKVSIVSAGASKGSSTSSSQEVTSRVKFNVHLRREINHTNR